QYQTEFTPYQERVDAPFNLSRETRWRLLNDSQQSVDFAGHLIGGCLDTISWLAGTAYGNVPGFVKRSGDTGVIMYLENADMNPCSLVRCLRSLRRHGWFDQLNGLLIGRNSGPEPEDKERLGYTDALRMVLGDLKYPILIDVDIGHRSPQMTLVNGAYAVVNFEESGGTLSQNVPKLNATTR
ncbi:MAG: LD-carboxypeptidase, partial [Cyanobacteria bacterium J06632_3]